MKRIAILSDTHGVIEASVVPYLEGCDAIFHAGDVGDIQTIEALQQIAPTWAVYGNIDDSSVRSHLSEVVVTQVEDVTIAMTHIGGYPQRYTKQGIALVRKHRPNLFISGHSHILKVMPDGDNHLLHINPGAIGNSGWHRVKTLVRLSIEGSRMFDLEVVEFPRG